MPCWEGDLVARDLLVGPTGTIKGSPPIAFDTIRSVAASSEPKREASEAERAIASKK